MTAAVALDGRKITTSHNEPPPEPTPFDLSKQEIDDLFDEAKNWLDGAGVQSQADADGVSKLIDKLRKAANLADERRIEMKRPHDEAAAAVQEMFNPLIAGLKDKKAKTKGRAVIAIETAKAALAPWLEAVEAKQRAEAEAARIEAEKLQEIARTGMLAARVACNLEAREAAEALVHEAKAAEKVATKAENAKAHASGGTRAIGLRTVYRAEVTDMRDFARYAWKAYPSEMAEFLTDLARRKVAAGNHQLPGVVVHIDRVL